MGDIESLTRRYQKDAAFKTVVDLLMHTIMTLQVSPSEVREAAMFAVYRMEMLHGTARCSIEVVSAPGDRCGGTKRLADEGGRRCPGCRACS